MNNSKKNNSGLGFIDGDLYVEGSIHSQKKIVVSGTVNGSISGNQEIVVSETGNVHGKIEGNKIVVAGKVNGDLLAHKRLEVVSSANIQGKMKAPSGQISIKEGANLEAKCKVIIEQKKQKKLSN